MGEMLNYNRPLRLRRDGYQVFGLRYSRGPDMGDVEKSFYKINRI